MKTVVKKQQGFTLLELVVVVAVLGLIASMATEFVVLETNQARYDLTKERRANIRTALVDYYDDCRNYPANLDWLVVKSLLPNNICGSNNDDWKGPYILDVDFESNVAVYRDGWGNASGANPANDHNFGWRYTNNTTSVELGTLGLDRRIGQISSDKSEEFKFEADEGLGHTLLTAPSSSNFFLISVASGGVNLLSCRQGSASTAANQVSISNCL